jgi:hypothetical protein
VSTLTKRYSAPTSIHISSGVVAAVAGGESDTGHILVGNGTVMGMGSNEYGAIGNAADTGTRGTAALPYRAMAIGGGKNSTYASVFQLQQAGDGQYVNVANLMTGTDVTGNFFGWGEVNNAYQTTDLTTNAPVQITDLRNETNKADYRGQVMMMGGNGATYTIDGNGNMILSGGNNYYGELGRGTIGGNAGRLATPQFLTTADNSGILSATSGDNHTAYVDALGSVWSFGLNNMSQLGNQSLTRPYQPSIFETGSLLTVEGEKASVELVMAADHALFQDGASLNIPTSFDLAGNYEVSRSFNLLKNDAEHFRFYDLRTANADGRVTVTYTSLDNKVAYVDADGILIPVGYGQTDILVSVSDGTTIRELLAALPADQAAHRL